MKEYNGHRSWNAWNVSLWINNNEILYNTARNIACEHRGNRQNAANAMLYRLECKGITETPDGAPYTAASILLAMRGII